MTKTRVVGTAPYPVTLSNGGIVGTGDVVDVTLDESVQVSIDLGRLAVAPAVEPEAVADTLATKPRSKTASTTTSQETE